VRLGPILSIGLDLYILIRYVLAISQKVPQKSYFCKKKRYVLA